MRDTGNTGFIKISPGERQSRYQRTGNLSIPMSIGQYLRDGVEDDPQFENPEQGDYQLKSGSPVV